MSVIEAKADIGAAHLICQPTVASNYIIRVLLRLLNGQLGGSSAIN